MPGSQLQLASSSHLDDLAGSSNGRAVRAVSWTVCWCGLKVCNQFQYGVFENKGCKSFESSNFFVKVKNT